MQHIQHPIASSPLSTKARPSDQQEVDRHSSNRINEKKNFQRPHQPGGRNNNGRGGRGRGRGGRPGGRSPPRNNGNKGGGGEYAVNKIAPTTGVPFGHLPAYLPGSSSLVEELDERIMIVLRDGRHLVGVSASYSNSDNRKTIFYCVN